MSFIVGSTTAINSSRAGSFASVNVGTSQPGSPSTGDIYYNTSTGLQVYNGSAWVSVGGGAVAQTAAAKGGALIYTRSRCTHIFSGSGTFQAFRSITSAEILCVAGGGGGGSAIGGGGGAGGFRYISSTTIPTGTYAVTVGVGGTQNQNGGPSSMGPLASAVGGGKGGSNGPSGSPGGSGGGGSHGGPPNGVRSNGGSGTSGQGNAGGGGGNNGMSCFTGGGGGGAGGAGTAASVRPIGQGTTFGGSGGNATSTQLPGTTTYMCAGGGGGVNRSASDSAPSPPPLGPPCPGD